MPQVVDRVQLIEQERLAKLLRRKHELERTGGLVFYRPHKKQDAFHRFGDRKYRYVRTGNRWGKSQCGSAEDVAWALGERPWYPKSDPARYAGIPRRPTKGAVLVYDWDKAEEIFTATSAGGMGKLFQHIPEDALAGTSKGNGGQVVAVKVRSVWGGVSLIQLDTVKSFVQNPMGHVSSSWDWVHVDEPIPHQMWKAYARGLIDSDGSAWFLCTPLNEPWINDFFVPNRWQRLDGVNDYGKKIVIVGDSYDNPYLNPDAIEEFSSLLTEDERQCRIHGIPLAMSGLVYKEFKRDVHVYMKPPMGWQSMNQPPAEYTVRYAIDPHPHQPHAVLFAATAPTGEVFFFEEIFEQCMLKLLAERVHRIVDGRFVELALVDPLAFIENPIDGQTMADELWKHGLPVEKATKDLAHGILSVQAILRERSSEGKPRVYFSEGLLETLWEFDHYEWDQRRPNKPRDKDDHMMECLYRLVLNGLEFVEQEKGTNKFVPQATVGVDFSLP